MCIEIIKREIRSAQTYYKFWNSNRHLPTAAETADYFASRLVKLKEQLNEHEQKSKSSKATGAKIDEKQ
jgi:hypothetical protein